MRKIHWKQNKYEKYSACDKSAQEKNKLENIKYVDSDEIDKVSCKKCRKQYCAIGNYYIWND